MAHPRNCSIIPQICRQDRFALTLVITNPDNQQLKMDILQQTVLEVLAERIRSEIN